MSGPSLLAGAMMYVGLWLLVPASVLPPGAAIGRARARERWLVPVSAVAALAAAWQLGVSGPGWWIGIVGALLVLALLRRLARAQRIRRERAARRVRVLELCDALAAELAGGIPMLTALEHACEDWAELAPVASAARLDGDVTGTMRAIAVRPGARGLAAVATAWEVAGRSGVALALVVQRTAESLRHEADAAAEVSSALGPPRATARLLLVLPVFGVALGMSMGADPLRFLLSTPVGLGCLAAGTVLALLGVLWVERLAAAAEE